MNLSKDKKLGMAFVVAGVLLAWVIGIVFVYLGESIPLSMFTLPAILILLGLALFFFDLVEGHLEIEDEIDNFSELIKDDIEALKRRELTTTHLSILATLFLLFIQITAIFLWRKWQAEWLGFLNVVFLATIVVIITAYVGIKSHWFQKRSSRLSWWTFLIPLFFYGLSAFFGIYYAEPKFVKASSLPVNQEVSYQYYWEETRGGQIEIFNNLNFSSDADIDIDCDDEGCLALLLILIGIVCVLGSVFIPHFWVVATALLWTIMALITARELLYSDAYRPRRAWW